MISRHFGTFRVDWTPLSENFFLYAKNFGAPLAPPGGLQRHFRDQYTHLSFFLPKTTPVKFCHAFFKICCEIWLTNPAKFTLNDDDEDDDDDDVEEDDNIKSKQSKT